MFRDFPGWWCIVNNITGNNLIASVYHRETAELYAIPFRSAHPRHVFVNVIDCALLRAILYSSTLKEFDHKRRAIKLMLLYNGYPIRYIFNRFKQLFNKYSITSTSIIPIIHDENEYYYIRRRLLDQPTVNEHGRAK